MQNFGRFLAVIAIAGFALLLSTLITWGAWNWFGANTLNAAMPGLQARQIDFWTAMGLSVLALFIFASAANRSSK